jgi:hypothetical protein
VLSDLVAVHIPEPEEVRLIVIALSARLPGRSVRLIDTGLLLVSAVRLQRAGAEALTAISIVGV